MTMPSATMPSSPTIRHKCPKPGPSHAHHMTSRLTRRLLPLAADARTRVYRPSAVSSPPVRAPGREDRGSFLPYSPACPVESGYSRKLLYCVVYRYALGPRLSAASLPSRVGPFIQLATRSDMPHDWMVMQHENKLTTRRSSRIPRFCPSVEWCR